MTAAATTTTPFPSPNSDSIYKAIHPQRRRPQIRRRNRLNAGSSGDNDEGERGPALSLRQISEGRRVRRRCFPPFVRWKREGRKSDFRSNEANQPCQSARRSDWPPPPLPIASLSPSLSPPPSPPPSNSRSAFEVRSPNPTTDGRKGGRRRSRQAGRPRKGGD